MFSLYCIFFHFMLIMTILITITAILSTITTILIIITAIFTSSWPLRRTSELRSSCWTCWLGREVRVTSQCFWNGFSSFSIHVKLKRKCKTVSNTWRYHFGLSPGRIGLSVKKQGSVQNLSLTSFKALLLLLLPTYFPCFHFCTIEDLASHRHLSWSEKNQEKQEPTLQR